MPVHRAEQMFSRARVGFGKQLEQNPAKFHGSGVCDVVVCESQTKVSQEWSMRDKREVLEGNVSDGGVSGFDGEGTEAPRTPS